MTTLYEITDARALLDEWFAEHDGELTPELDALLTAWEQDFDTKAERVALYVVEQKANAASIAGEIERLTARKKAMEQRAASLTRYLELCFARTGTTKVNGLLCTIAVQKNPPRVEGELAPETLAALKATDSPFVRVVPESVTLDRKAILDAYKQGTALPVGLTVTQSDSLRIR